jgi:hypothetical protein
MKSSAKSGQSQLLIPLLIIISSAIVFAANTALNTTASEEFVFTVDVFANTYIGLDEEENIVKAYLFMDNGTAIGNQKVDLYLNETMFGSSITDEKGLAEFVVPEGEHEIEAAFEGNESLFLNPSEIRLNFRLKSSEMKTKSEGITMSFDRNLDCHKCGNHKAPPLTNINMTISVEASEVVENGVLIEYYPKDWTIINANSGTESDYDSTYNKIEWFVGNVSQISKSYIIESPERTTPSTKYYFQSELGGVKSDTWMVVVSDPGWLTGWTYRKSHVIQNASGAGTNYQINITIINDSSSDSGGIMYIDDKMRSDFGDVRFTDDDGTTLLDYWIENKTDGVNATFWVEVADNLNDTNQTIYVYYGNAEASTTSNADATFPFADVFDSGSLNETKWDSNITAEGSVTVSGGTCLIENDESNSTPSDTNIHGATYFGQGYSLRMRTRFSDWANYLYVHQAWRSTGSPVDGAYFSRESSSYHWSWRNYNDGSATREDKSSTSPVADTWYIWELMRNGSTNTIWNRDNVEKGTIDTNLPDGDCSPFFDAGTSHSVHVYIEVDWVIVRKYVSSEPVQGSWGSEEEITSKQFNLTVYNSTGGTDTSSIISIYRSGTTVNSSNGYTSYDLNYTDNYTIEISKDISGSNVTAKIEDLNITGNLNLTSQIVPTYIGGKPSSLKPYFTPLYILNDTGLTFSYVNITIPKNGLDVDYIIHCLSWDYDNANCTSWEVNDTSDYDFYDDGTYIFLNVTSFDGYGGGDDSDKAMMFLSNNTSSVNTSGLVGYWKFDEGLGNKTYDKSGYNNTGNINDSSWVAGRFGIAINFSDGSDYVSCGNDTSLNITKELTVDFWVNVHDDAPSGLWPMVVSKGSQSNGWVIFQEQNGHNLSFAYYNGTDTNWPSGRPYDLQLNKWHHIALTFSVSQNAVKSYLDGVLQTNDPAMGEISSNTQRFYVGLPWYYGTSFNGSVDEVQIWNRSLSADEVKELYPDQLLI